MKIDSHQHFWKYNVKEYNWINDSMSVLRRDFLPSDLKEQLDSTGFDGSVAVGARQDIYETDWLLELAEKNEFIKGVVGWVSLVDEKVEAVLEKYAANEKLKGVRHIVHDEPDDEFILREDFVKGVSKLAKYDLTYDILIFPRHIRNSVEFVKKFPEQSFVVDHIAKPFIKNGQIEPWKSNMEEFGSFENVYCKISGMVTEADWQNWKKQDFHVYMETVLDIFGADRLMFGSDWPVCEVAAEYNRVLEIAMDFIGKLSQSEQNKIVGENATRFYNLRK